MKPALIIVYFIAFLVACNNPGDPSKKTRARVAETEKPHPFFPVTSFLKGQVFDIKNMGINPLKIIQKNGRPDSTWLKVETLENEFSDFLKPVIDSMGYANFFEEKSFMDQTLNTVTLTYDPITKLPDSILFRRWDIYIDPEKNTVQRIYLVKQVAPGKIRQLTWQAGKQCRGITIVEDQAGTAKTEDDVIIKWAF
jgi:hypothetical protein